MKNRRFILIQMIGILILTVLTTEVQATRGRVQISNSTIKSDRGTLIRGGRVSLDIWDETPSQSDIDAMKNRGLNAVHIYAEYAGSGRSGGYNSAKVDNVVNLADRNDLYVILTIGCGGANGSFDATFVEQFWNYYAPRYKDKTHVVYEIMNEPQKWSAPYNSATLDMERNTFNLIRWHAPNTHIMLMSYSQPNNWTQAANECANLGVSWSNASVAFHTYGIDNNESFILSSFFNAMKGKGIAYACTEPNLNIQETTTKIFESNGVSQTYFINVHNIATNNSSFYNWINSNGICWTPDFGTWPSCGGCDPTSITPYVQVDDGSWQQTSSVTVDAGAKVKFGPQPTSGGSWSWSGGGTSGTSREQTIYPTSSVTATATYTNSCGAHSTQNFTVSVNGGVSTTVHLAKRNASGFALDGGNGGANGRQIYLWSSDVNNVNQSWVEIDRGNGYYSYQKLNTDYCIDGGNGGANGQAVVLWQCDANNENQHWQKIDAGNSNYRLQKRNSPGYSIDGNNGGANEQGVYLWASDANNENQQWTFSSSSLKSTIIATEEESISSTEKILAYPNPVTDVLNLQLSVSVNEIAIFSLEGKELYRQNSTSDNVEIDMSDYKPGIYFVKAIGQNETLTQKVLKK